MATPVHTAIRNARAGAGLSLRELARRVDVSPATLSAIETGKTGVSVDRLRVLADALGTSAADLLSPPSAGTVILDRNSEVGHPAPGSWREFPAMAIDSVLSAAIEGFVETGYHGATMRSIATRAGVSVPGVYHHYRDKQDLLVRILDLTMDELHWRVRAARDEGRSAIGRVALIVEALALYHTHRRDLAFIGASEMRSLEPDNRARIAQSRNDLQHMLDHEIAGAIGAGELDTRHPADAGRAISTMCTSLPQWFRIDGPSTPEQIAREYADFALDLLRRT
jgi:AcrR family transcriptional regulator